MIVAALQAISRQPAACTISWCIFSGRPNVLYDVFCKSVTVLRLVLQKMLELHQGGFVPCKTGHVFASD